MRPMDSLPSQLTEPIIIQNHRTAVEAYLSDTRLRPLLLLGDAHVILEEFPESRIDIVMTSPPYWGKRDYADGGIGMEPDYHCYIQHLAQICLRIKRVLKPGGSFWLNLGDTYHNGSLSGIPWRVACELTDHQGWILRNSVIWNKVKSGMDNTTNRLGNVHEYVFHFVKQPKYYYNVDAIRSKPRKAKIVKGAVVSATGVSGVRYRRQIELSTALSEEEKQEALKELNKMLEDVAAGRIADFRMIIRGQQRTTHSDSERVSGRARELSEKGFYFLCYHPNGSKPGDVWDILPEDTQHRDLHFAPYPVDLCRIPILATCPEDGVVLDPFCGTGTTLVAARDLGRRSIGIDISQRYLELALQRCQTLL
jgi:DNA modification methylase